MHEFVDDGDDGMDAGGGDKVVEEDDDDYIGNELFVNEEDKDNSDDEGDGNDGENKDQSDAFGDGDDAGDDDYEEGDNDVREVINVNLTDHLVDEFKKMKKQNKYFTIGYNEFMWSNFEEVNK
eukprot:14985890-Ditylum_brightwellii.AAC.1